METDGVEIPEESSIGRVALRVNDLDRTNQFYESVVGLDRLGGDDGRVILGAGGTRLLVLLGDPDAPERTRDETGLFHAAFRVPSRAALGDAAARVEENWRLAGASDHLVSEALYLADPEGNGVELYRDRPREEWPVDDDGRVAIDTLPLDVDDVRREGRGNDRVPPDTVVGHVHLEVSSLSAAREFYADALGLGVRKTYGRSALFLAAGDYHHHVAVNVWNRRSKRSRGRGLAWFELVVPDREAIAEIGDLCERRGYVVSRPEGDEQSHDEYESVEIEDADGIRVRLSAPA